MTKRTMQKNNFDMDVDVEVDPMFEFKSTEAPMKQRALKHTMNYLKKKYNNNNNNNSNNRNHKSN